MADPVRLLLDEDTRPLLAETLRDRGFDAVHVNQLRLSGAADVDVLREATRQGRALLTPQRPFRELLARTLRFLAVHTAEDVRNAVLWLPT
ncbi:MAG: DUF5615 family PIN-like protein [Planctomycetia bacterium]|nr:DUF5615 family PIN-like protein [Planctomycetia bacterium]